MTVENERLANFGGEGKGTLNQMKKHCDVNIYCSSNCFQLSGEESNSIATMQFIKKRYSVADKEVMVPAVLQLYLNESSEEKRTENVRGEIPQWQVKTRNGPIKGRGQHQTEYLDKIKTNELSLGIGPAGTGKTYLAVACAVDALVNDEVDRLDLVRPAVEAGERLGFLPGDLAQKIDPYLRPMYDALYETMGTEKVAKLLEQNIIEIAPLAYMRGRTLNDAFIILDEAQNTTIEQMKMFLTRIGFGSKAVVTGDITQVDLPREKVSGLRHAIHILENIEGIGITHFDAQDVVRHPLVKKIVTAYEREDGP